MIRARNRALALAAVGVLSLALAGSATAGDKLKLGSLAPENSSWGTLLQDFGREVSERSNGELEVKLYLGGAQGDEPDMVRKMRSGQLTAGAFTLNGLYAISPEMAVLSLPFLFESLDEVDHIRDTMFETFNGYFVKEGFRLIALLDQAPNVQLYTNGRATTPEELAKQKMWVWAGERVATATYEALGIVPIGLEVPQVVMSLQTGMVNGLYTGPYTLMALQWHPYIDHVLMLNLRFEPGAIVVREKTWQKLSDAERAAVEKAASVMGPKEIRMVRKDEADALAALAAEGKTIVELTPAERQVFIDRTRSVWDELAGDMYPRELLDQVLAELERYRASKSAPAN